MAGVLTDWDRLGGEAGARRLLSAFLDRMFADPIIGFRFEHVPKDALLEAELGHVSAALGGPLPYQGRPLGQAHRRHRINAGQFRRRLALLATVGRELGVDEGALERWLAHDRALLGVITDGTDCLPPDRS